jgi:hypothetical protein
MGLPYGQINNFLSDEIMSPTDVYLAEGHNYVKKVMLTICLGQELQEKLP